jgi:DNA helicase-2/ATP-dependent DNA helicase PcrA
VTAWTDEQREILDHPVTGAHAVVRAVPGSGKTTTLVARVVRLCERGVDPARIRVVMFNKSIQQTCAARLAEAGVDRVRVTTFDALGLAVIGAAERRGLLSRPLEVVPNGTLEWARAVHRRHRDEIDCAEDIADFVAFLKAHLVAPARAAYPSRPAFVTAYQEFEALRLSGSVLRVAFEDMVYTAVGLLRQHPRLLGPIDQILVDEFQDVNPARVEIIKRLIHDQTAVFAVGDEDQGINEWCGAHPRFLRDFNNLFPTLPTTVYPLSRSFRFGRVLATAAAALISRNKERTPVDIVGGGVTAGRVATIDDPAREIKRLIADRWAPADLAVLYRGRPQAAGILAQLIGANIPVHTDDLELLRTGKGPELALAYLRLATHTGPVGFDEAWSIAWTPDSYINKEKFSQQVARFGAKGLRAVLLKAAKCGQNPSAITSQTNLADLLARVARSATAGAALDRVRAEVDIDELLRARIHSERHQELAIAAFDGVHQLLAGLGVAPADAVDALLNLDARRGQPAEACIWVSTIHKAKGMEWRCVLLPALSEGLCPAEERGAVPGTRDEPDGVAQSPWIEQERRIFYVGLTRAADQALLHPAGRPSRFLAELTPPAPPQQQPKQPQQQKPGVKKRARKASA